MSRSLHIADRAHGDIGRIFAWLVRHSVRGAVAWYLAFRSAARRVVANPESYAVAAESHRLSQPVRQAFFKTRRGRPYRIVFEFTEDEVVILRVRGPGQAPLRSPDLWA